MAMKLYSDTDIQNIANAIRAKNGSSDTYKVSQMATAIQNIPSGGGTSPSYNISAITVSYGDTSQKNVTATLPQLRSLTIPTNPANTTEVIDIDGVVGGEVSIINGGNAQNNSGALKVINLHGADAVLPSSNYGLRYRTNLETVNAKIRCLVTNTGNQFTGSTKLKDLYWQENAQTISIDVSAPPLTNDSLISLANGLSETTAATVTLSSARKTTCGTIVGKSVEVTGDTTYHRFVEDANETLTLTEFITTVKGWTLA